MATDPIQDPRIVQTELEAVRHIKSPSPETPGLRQATRELVVIARWSMDKTLDEKTRVATLKEMERHAIIVGNLLRMWDEPIPDTPPNREGVVLEGELLEAVRPGNIEFWCFDCPDDWTPPEGWPATDDFSIPVRATFTPLGESGGEQ